MGRLDEARVRLLAALRMFQETIDVSGYTLVLDSLAGLTMRQGDPLSAATIAGAVDTLERTTGTTLNRTNRHLLRLGPGATAAGGPATARPSPRARRWTPRRHRLRARGASAHDPSGAGSVEGGWRRAWVRARLTPGASR